MANKFQKSVLERLEQENNRKRDKAVKPETVTRPDSAQEQTKGVTKATSPKKTAPVAPISPKEVETVDISAYLRRDTQRTAKNKTFYLDTDVIEAVKSTARVQKVTDSKLVNDILRKILGLHE